MGKRIGLYALMLVGILSAVGFTVWNWHDLATEGKYSMGTAFMMPLLAVVGVGQFIIDRTSPGNLMQRFDQRGPRAKKMLYVAIGLGVLAGVVNTYCMDRAFEALPLPPGGYRQY